MAEEDRNRIIADAGEGNEQGEDEAERQGIDAHRVLARMQAAERGDVHELEAFDGPKRNGSLDNEESIEEAGDA